MDTSDLDGTQEPTILQLQVELERVKQELHASTARYEAAIRAFAYSSAELKSIDELKRSTGPELEGSKEELRTINDALMAINDELRKQIDAINEKSDDLQNLMNSNNIGTILLDRNLCVKRYTTGVEDLFDIEAADLGRPLHHLNSRLPVGELYDNAERVLREHTMVEHELQHMSGNQWFLVRLRPYRTFEDEVEGVVIAFVDISHVKLYDTQLESNLEALEMVVAARTEQVRQLASELIRAEQAERQRIGQLLHDDMQQLLHAVRARMERLSRSLLPEQAEQLSHADHLISKALEITHALANDLGPAVLKGNNFTLALEWLAIQMEDLHGLKVVVDSAPVYLADHLRSVLYQLVRELLFNVVKHANTDSAHVKLDEKDGQIVLRVSDEGSGFDGHRIQVPAKQGGLGLPSVKYRLDLLGGRLEVTTAPGQGTRATIFLPIPHDIALAKHGPSSTESEPTRLGS